jgi:deoxycytidylate deaminase
VTRPNWDDTWLEVARVVARRSLCVRDQVGAVIVDPRNRIVATGYNGPPSGFTVLGGRGDDDLFTGRQCSEWCARARKQQTGWKTPPVLDERFRDIEVRVANGKTWIIRNEHKWELTESLAHDLGLEPVYANIESDYSDCPSLHAEANALSVCDRSVREGGTIYVTSDVCFACAKLIANSGLSSVCAVLTDKSLERQSDKSYKFLEQCGVTVYHYE